MKIWWHSKKEDGGLIEEEEWAYAKTLLVTFQKCFKDMPEDLSMFAGIILAEPTYLELSDLSFYANNKEMADFINQLLGGGEKTRNLYSFGEMEFNYVNILKEAWLLELAEKYPEQWYVWLADIESEKSEHFWEKVSKMISLEQWQHAVKTYDLTSLLMKNCYVGCRIPYRLISQNALYEKRAGYFYAEIDAEKRYLLARAFGAYLEGEMTLASWYLKILTHTDPSLNYLYYETIPHDTETYPIAELDNVLTYFLQHGKTSPWFDETLLIDIKNAYILKEPYQEQLWERCHVSQEMHLDETALWLSC